MRNKEDETIEAASPSAENPTASTPDKASWTGLQIVEAIGTGRISPPPMMLALPLALQAWSEGAIELRARPEARFYNLMKIVHGGWSMTMLDTAMGLTALTTLRPGEMCPSLETSVKFIKPIVEEAGELRVFGSVVSRGRSVITLHGRIEDAAGKLYAHGSSSCLIVTKVKN